MVNFTPTWKDVRPSGFYVYIHYRISDGIMFYVGRGNGNRGWQAKSGFRSNHWVNVANKHGVRVEIAQDNLSSEDADLLEEWLIAKYRSRGERLINITDGGGGTVGWVPSEVTRKKWSAAKRKAVFNSSGMRFEWVGGAVLWLKENGHPRATQSSVSSAAIGNTNQAYGFAWWYDGDNPKDVISRRDSIRESRGRAVIRSDGMEFSSISGAAEYMAGCGFPNASAGNISTGISTGRIRYGFIWSYA